MNDFTKDACVTAMICRIQNLLPDQCNLCKEQYCINITDTPLLSCVVCGQGTHDQCISKFLHLTELECQSFTTADAWSRINPTKLPGLHYLCMECTENTIPSEEAGKLKRKTKPTMMDDAETATTQLQDRGVSQLLHVFTQDNTPGGEDMGSEDSTQTPPQLIEHVTNASDNETTTQSVQNCTHSSDRTAGVSMRNVCPFYRRGICRYGVGGRLCPKDHPPACKKLTKHGNRSPDGCTLGRACDSFHPKMCPGSLSKRVCQKADCKLRHVTGTKRQQTDSPTKKSKKQETDPVSLQDDAIRYYAGTRPAASPSTEASFSSTATNADRASIPTASGVARQQLCDGAQRGSDQRSRHSNVKQHEHQPANDAGASATIPLAYFTLANIRGLKPRTVPSKVSFIQDLLQQNCQLFAATPGC